MALLRASNVPARFVRGTVALTDLAASNGPDGRAQRWLGTQSYSSSVAYLTNSGGVPGGPYSFNGSVQGISFDHVWVQACVPFAAYRGSLADGGGYRWVPLDPSVKDHDYQAGLAVDVPLDAAFYSAFLATRSSQLPPEFFADKVEQAARGVKSDASAEDVPYRGTPRTLRIDVLPSVTPFAVTQFSNWPGSSSSESATIPDAHRHKFTVTVTNGAGSVLASTTASYPQTAFQRVTVSYAPDAPSQALWASWGGALAALPAGGVNVYPQIKRDGVVVASGSAAQTMPLGASHTVLMKLTQGEEVDGQCINDNGNPASPRDGDASCLNKTAYTGLRAGAYYALGVNARQMSDALLSERARTLANAVRSYPSAPTPAAGVGYDATVGELLHLVLQNYLLETERADQRIAALRGYQSLGNFDIGLTGADLKTDYLFDLPFTVKPAGVYIDFKGGIYSFAKQATAADFSANRPATLAAEQVELAKLSIYAGSALEHHVWQQALRTDAISTVRGLQYAAETGVSLVTLTNANIAQFDSLMQMSGPTSMAAFKPSLQAEVAGGASVTVPRAQISYTDPVDPSKAWRGAVYMTENSATGRYGAIINGAVSGGYPLLNSTPYAALWAPNGNAPGFVDQLGDGLGRLLGLAPGTQGSNPLASWLGDPVNMLTGNLVHNERDLAIKGRGDLPIVLERWYHSGDPQDGPLGFGWSHSFGHVLKFYGVEGGAAKVGWLNGSGGETFYATAAHTVGDIARAATLTNPAGANVAFTRVAGGADDGKYHIRERNGLVYLFASVTAPGGLPSASSAVLARLLSITDRNGNSLTLSYNGALLNTVTDSLGRTVLSFTWAGNRISQVSDYSGRSVKYAYADGNGNGNGNGNLTQATDALNQVHRYSYYAAVDGPKLNHRLKRHTLPRGNGMEFAYYSGGHVQAHTPFDSAGALIAEGAISFHYDSFNREAWSVNQRGHEHRFTFDVHGNPQRIVDASDAEHSYTYDPARPHNRLSETDSVGRSTAYTYNNADLIETVPWSVVILFQTSSKSVTQASASAPSLT